MIKLGVNIDHVATIRQARKGRQPDPVMAAAVCEHAGCDSIVCHLREDRRHIQDRDLVILRETVKTMLNLEMATAEEVVAIAVRVRPEQATLVPERREELTTEGGLDVRSHLQRIREVTTRLQEAGTRVSLFIEPHPDQIAAAKEAGARFIEIHTGRYADSITEKDREIRLTEIISATEYARSIGLRVNAGHGLDYLNTAPICTIPGIEELNIGHSIIARAVIVGLDRAVRDMLTLIKKP